jgi:ABC-type glycerol-3-phosphate transport system permease component
MFYILVLRMVPPITAIVPLYFPFLVTGLGGTYVAIIGIQSAVCDMDAEELHR